MKFNGEYIISKRKFYSIALVSAALILMLVNLGSATLFTYVANHNSNNVSVIDTAQDVVTATIDVGNGPWGITATPNGRYLYVANEYDNDISVIDTTTNTIITNISVGAYPLGLAVNPTGTRVYVPNWGSSTVSVINTANNIVIATLDVGRGPQKIAVTPDGKKIYITNGDSNNVSVINTTTNTLEATVDGLNKPYGVAVSPDGATAYVSTTGGWPGNISVINTSTNNLITNISVGVWPNVVVVNPTGTNVYVTNGYIGTVSIIDTTTNDVTATVKVGSDPLGISITPDGKKIYVANSGSNNVSVIDATNNTVIVTLDVGAYPAGISPRFANAKFGGFYDIEYPGPTSYYAANINLTVDTPVNVTLPIVDLTPGRYDDFAINVTNISTVPSSLIVTLNNSTAIEGTGIYKQKHGDSVIGTSKDLANITNIAVWVETSNDNKPLPDSNDFVLNMMTGVWSSGTNILPAGVAFSSLLLPLTSNALNMTNSSNYIIHYIVSLPSTLTGSQVAAGTSVQGEQGSIGNIITLQNN